MARVDTWDPWNWPVQGGLKEGEFASSTHTLIASGPPHLAEIDAADIGNAVYPVGLCQDFAWGQTQGVARFYEIGSKRSYVVTGHAAGGITLTDVYYSGPSLLRRLYGVWPDYDGKTLWPTTSATVSPQNPEFGTPYIPPGYENFLYNLQSDFFGRPFGLMLIVHTNLNQTLIVAYFEEGVVPGLNLNFNAQTVILQESATVDYERVVPVRANYSSLENEKIKNTPY